MNMRFVSIVAIKSFLVILLLLASLQVYSQKPFDDCSNLKSIPSEQLLMLIAVQDDSPVHIQNPQAIFNVVDQSISFSFQVRNQGNKAVRQVLLTKWHLGGGGGDLKALEFQSARGLRPGAVFYQNGIGPCRKPSVVFPTMLPNQNGKMISAIAWAVKEVWFTDGSHYEAAKTTDMFSAFANRLVLDQK
jgi:hypothetical protein